MRSDYRIWETIVVHWGDMDAMGHVNNARYFTYCESARFRYFHAIPLDAFGEGGRYRPVLAATSCNFRRQVRYPATLEVGARTVKVGTTSFTMEYGLFEQGSDELSADSTGVLVWMEYATGKPVPLPEALKERLRALDGI